MNFTKFLLASGLIIMCASAQASLSPDDEREMNRLLNASPALTGFAKGIEKQYDLKCQPYLLSSYSGIDFQEGSFAAASFCLTKGPAPSFRAVLEVEGTVIEESPLMISVIQLHFLQ
jgi:hypothetical protein